MASSGTEGEGSATVKSCPSGSPMMWPNVSLSFAV